ncbi:scoloptoxin SSD976-like [Pollicipes pollicipes]|uniref:scoloptoxin SSD976-like n=1 Tax=Pollicipes pollicipes TaxID=41117 RepID=UPI00188555A7|nr:scoloptoxin SSD976-like [Pollicipes pollicipes]
MSRQLAQDLVHLHNVMRSRVARGLVDGQGGKLPQAADMLQTGEWEGPVFWQRQGCCHTGTYGHFAQAVWSITRYIGCGVVTHQGGLGTEGTKCNSRQGCCHTGTYGHFAQAVWSITRYIGCGVVTYQGGLGTKVLLYCNYGPGGNVVSKPTYRMGRKCSACPQGTKCNSRYDGLCNVAS